MNSTGTTPAKRASVQQPASSSQIPAFSHREGKKKKNHKVETFCPHLWSWILNRAHYHYLLRTQDHLHPKPPVQTVRQGYLVGIPYSSTLLDMCHLVPFWWVWLLTLWIWSTDRHISERFNYGERPVLNECKMLHEVDYGPILNKNGKSRKPAKFIFCFLLTGIMCPAASGFITTFPVFKDWTFLNSESKVNTPSLQLLLVRYLLREQGNTENWF